MNLKKDKIKAPSAGAQKYPAVFCPSPRLPKRLLQARSDKHSDLTYKRDTVMAVAADSHCDFLIPECAEAHPTTGQAPMNCVLFFSAHIITQATQKVNRKSRSILGFCIKIHKFPQLY
jgi:hypothetical protein